MDSALVTVLINAGIAGVVVLLMIFKWLVPKWVYDKAEAEARYYREALELERQRNAELASTTDTTTKLIGALADLATERRALPPAHRDPAATWRDLD